MLALFFFLCLLVLLCATILFVLGHLVFGAALGSHTSDSLMFHCLRDCVLYLLDIAEGSFCSFDKLSRKTQPMAHYFQIAVRKFKDAVFKLSFLIFLFWIMHLHCTQITSEKMRYFWCQCQHCRFQPLVLKRDLPKHNGTTWLERYMTALCSLLCTVFPRVSFVQQLLVCQLQLVGLGQMISRPGFPHDTIHSETIVWAQLFAKAQQPPEMEFQSVHDEMYRKLFLLAWQAARLNLSVPSRPLTGTDLSKNFCCLSTKDDGILSTVFGYWRTRGECWSAVGVLKGLLGQNSKAALFPARCKEKGSLLDSVILNFCLFTEQIRKGKEQKAIRPDEAPAAPIEFLQHMRCTFDIHIHSTLNRSRTFAHIVSEITIIPFRR